MALDVGGRRSLGQARCSQGMSNSGSLTTSVRSLGHKPLLLHAGVPGADLGGVRAQTRQNETCQQTQARKGQNAQYDPAALVSAHDSHARDKQEVAA